ncbi:MAG: transposase, partial [bacterium]|nr:transposase [bacterium]
SGDVFIDLRKLVSGYEDVVKAGVRLKNQRASLFRAKGRDKREKRLEDRLEGFVLEGIEGSIELYERQKKSYEEEMGKLSREHLMIRNLDSIPGIGKIEAVKVAARVVDPKRFGDKGKWLSYCGLIRHDRMSGGRSYGKKDPRYCRMMKSVFKTAALNVIGKNAKGLFREYYEDLMSEKGYSEDRARHALARRIAVIALGVMKSGKGYKPKRRLECNKMQADL